MSTKHMVRCVSCGKRFDADSLWNLGTLYNRSSRRYSCPNCARKNKIERKKALQQSAQYQHPSNDVQATSTPEQKKPSWFRKNWAMVLSIFGVLGIIVMIGNKDLQGVLLYIVWAIGFGLAWFFPFRKRRKAEQLEAESQARQRQLQEDILLQQKANLEAAAQQIAQNNNAIRNSFVTCPACGALTKNGVVCEYCNSILNSNH